MKNRIKTWEIILAGWALTALSIYVLIPSGPVPADIEQKIQSINWKIPHAPQAPEIPKEMIIELEKIEIELSGLKQNVRHKELEVVEKELKKAEKELSAASRQLKEISLPSLKGLPEILIPSS